MDEIRRQFDVEISIPVMTGRLYSGRFNNKDLNRALELVCLPMGLSFEIQNNKTVIVKDLRD
jgi:hypothetical protein